MNWQLWIYTVWLVGIGYCFGRAHAYYIQYMFAVKKLKDLEARLNVE